MIFPSCGESDRAPADVPTHVLDASQWDEIDGATERIAAWCAGDLLGEDGDRIANEGFDTLEGIARREPHGIYHSEGVNQTMVELLENMEMGLDDCSYAEQLAEIGARLRER